MISIIVAPYLIWRSTGTIRTRIRRAKMDGARGGGWNRHPLWVGSGTVFVPVMPGNPQQAIIVPVS
ncbi:hypothetical protein G7085_11790 [Tessaracoccus sp. HDW20]|uniref:hypothetical protein n=1 Tax=Tessaracoccus coleopterorum TaxID=2714950 RepID=UPI0018D41626|nr:hypothetical protein [Tessaracoccus coleopterorum]NHB85067.1 hypothetical protein [Tessaracoccus coleopterorum]